MPFISRISRAWQVRENLNIIAFSVVGSKNAKITGSKVITLTQMPKLRVAKIKDSTVFDF